MSGLPEKFRECGFVYWDFFLGKHGNPYTVLPTARMVQGHEIHTKKYREFVPGGSKKENGIYLEPVNLEVYYDWHYVYAYREKMRGLFDVLLLLEKPVRMVLVDTFDDFEKSNGIEVSTKNPRHSLYIKYKDAHKNGNTNS